ncbi:MAG: type I DNA topoisomerase [Pseudomonadota bacterium]
MSVNLLLVESPAKAKTIKKYLGKSFQVLATYGHVLDLPRKQNAIVPERDFTQNDFEPKLIPIEKNEKHIDAIAKAAKKAKIIYLATDPDREGEAISWHIQQILEEKKLLNGKDIHRVVFYQITKKAVNDAVANPRDVSRELVQAQQARRVLDYLVGFRLSPLLWKKVRPGLSAGRVQSPALCMIVEREEEIDKFVPQEYWTINALALYDKQNIEARLIQYNNEKVEQFTVTNEEQAQAIQADLLKQAKGKLQVIKVEKKQRKRNPAAPFITSTLQQEAARKLGFSAQRTMRIAQQLYEGIDFGSGVSGLITYMRTDSVNLAAEAVAEIREVIASKYGKENVPAEVRSFKRKVRNAQEAHEAIRPTSAANIPDEIKSALTTDQYKLYNLIWKRTLASQMLHATMNTVAITLACGSEKNLFRVNGSTIANPGFLKLYQEGLDDAKSADQEDKILPPMQEGDELKLNEIPIEQHFTEPPPRYSEASLIKALEEHGIGRPSTYASILSTIVSREYVILDQKRFKPTDVGRVVKKFLTNYFTKYVDYDFTAGMENELDEISRGEKQWIPMMKEFWEPFKSQLDTIEETVQRKDVTQEKMDEKCPKCDKPLVLRLGRGGRFVGCTGYPDCDYTRSQDTDDAQAQKEQEIAQDRKCPNCNTPLVIKFGRYGKFLGCANYPECKHIEPLIKPENTQVKCAECKQGDLLKRRSRYGKFFYSCERYPDCKYAVWNEPVAEPCPKCKWPLLTLKTTKRRGTEKVCPQKTCDYALQIEPPEGK